MTKLYNATNCHDIPLSLRACFAFILWADYTISLGHWGQPFCRLFVFVCLLAKKIVDSSGQKVQNSGSSKFFFNRYPLIHLPYIQKCWSFLLVTFIVCCSSVIVAGISTCHYDDNRIRLVFTCFQWHWYCLFKQAIGWLGICERRCPIEWRST